MTRIQDLVRADMVLLDLEASDKDDALHKLACKLAECDSIAGENPEQLCSKLMQREIIGSTAVGDGFALPHAYLEGLDRPLVLFARLKPPIDFMAEDNKPVDKILLSVGPKGNDREYLMILARISRLLRDKDFKARLQTLASGEEFVQAVTEAENRHRV